MYKIEIVNEIRTILFHFIKEYGKLEDEYHMVNPSDLDSDTFKYLTEVKDLFKNFGRVVDDIYVAAMANRKYKELK